MKRQNGNILCRRASSEPFYQRVKSVLANYMASGRDINAIPVNEFYAPDSIDLIGEGDSICEISHELVLDNWQSVPHTIPHECPFRWQIIRQRRKAVRRK